MAKKNYCRFNERLKTCHINSVHVEDIQAQLCLLSAALTASNLSATVVIVSSVCQTPCIVEQTRKSYAEENMRTVSFYVLQVEIFFKQKKKKHCYSCVNVLTRQGLCSSVATAGCRLCRCNIDRDITDLLARGGQADGSWRLLVFVPSRWPQCT